MTDDHLPEKRKKKWDFRESKGEETCHFLSFEKKLNLVEKSAALSPSLSYTRKQASQFPSRFSFCPSATKWPRPLPRRRSRAGRRSTTSASRAPTESSTTSAGPLAWAPSAGGSGTPSRARRTAPEEPGCAGVSRYDERGMEGGRGEGGRGSVIFFAIN